MARLIALGAAIAIVFAPGETLLAPKQASPSAVAAAVLAPTFVATPLLRPVPLSLADARAADEFPDAPSAMPPVVVTAGVLTLAAAGWFLRAPRPVRRTSAPERFVMWRHRAPPFPLTLAFE